MWTTSENASQLRATGFTIAHGRKNRQRPFFRLPAELRNVIYEDTLDGLGNVFAYFGGMPYVQPRCIGILYVNRKIYDETSLLPYFLNSITAGPYSKFENWI